MNEMLREIAEGTEGPIHSLAWMAQEANLLLPPIPAIYLNRLREFTHWSAFATDETLLRLTGPNSLIDDLDQGKWPVTGMALRLAPVGRWLYWEYILVGRIHLLQVNIRVLMTDVDARFRLASASTANAFLQSHLAAESTLARYLDDGERRPDETAHVVMYGNAAGGPPVETHARWTESSGLSGFRQEAAIFTRNPPDLTSGEIILRP